MVYIKPQDAIFAAFSSLIFGSKKLSCVELSISINTPNDAYSLRGKLFIVAYSSRARARTRVRVLIRCSTSLLTRPKAYRPKEIEQSTLNLPPQKTPPNLSIFSRITGTFRYSIWDRFSMLNKTINI